MTSLASSLAPLASYVMAIALHGVRLLPTAVLCPFLGGPMVPPLVRGALAVGLGACAWSASGGAPFQGSGLDVLVTIARELALGIGLGVAAAIPFEAARAGGRLVDTLRGATLAELHVAPVRQHESATGDLLVQSTIVLAASAGGDRLVVTSLLETFRAVPMGGAIGAVGILAAGLRGAAELVACAIAVGAPAAAGVLAADLAVTVASRAAPQLQLGATAQPARAALGLVAIAVPAAAIAGRLTAAVALAPELIRAMARPVAG